MHRGARLMPIDLDMGGMNPLLMMVQNIALEQNIFKKLENTDTIINALDDETKEKVEGEKFQKYIHSLYVNDAFMRQLQSTSTMKDNVESSLEYFGFDYLSNPDFTYDKEFEQKLMIIRKKLSVFYGSLIKELTTAKGIEL
jgi:hypothetical protein